MKKLVLSHLFLLSLIAYPFQAQGQIIIIEEDNCQRHHSDCDGCCQRRNRRPYRRPRRRVNPYRPPAPAPAPYRAPLKARYLKPVESAPFVEAPKFLDNNPQIKHWEVSLFWSSSADNYSSYSGSGVGMTLMFNNRWGIQGYLSNLTNYYNEDEYAYTEAEISIFRAGLSALWYPFGKGFNSKGFNFYLRGGLTAQNYTYMSGIQNTSYDGNYDYTYMTEDAGGVSLELGAGLKYVFFDKWFSVTLEFATMSSPFSEEDPETSQYHEVFGSSATIRFFTSFHF